MLGATGVVPLESETLQWGAWRVCILPLLLPHGLMVTTAAAREGPIQECFVCLQSLLQPDSKPPKGKKF